MLRCFACVFVIMTIIYSIDGFKCYACVGSLSSDCAKNKISSMSIQDCEEGAEDSNDIPQDLYHCMKITTEESKDASALVVRECAKFPKEKEAEFCKGLIITKLVKQCKTCDSDLCNV